MKITQVICQVLRVEKVAGQDGQLPGRRPGPDPRRRRHGRDRRGRFFARGGQGDHRCTVQPQHCLAGLRELLIGENPLETERLWHKMLAGTVYFGRTSVTITAMAAVDMALWDLKGKHFGEPIHRLLGGKRRNSNSGLCLDSLREARRSRIRQRSPARWREAGYRAIKFGWEPMGKSEALDLDLVRGARKGIGDDGTLLIDAGLVWDARTALRRANQFADYNIGWLEEPLRQDDVDGYVWLRDRSPVPIAAGEGECGREAFRPLIDRHALDVYQVDLSRCGFTDAAYIKNRVEEIGARLCNHCYTSPLTVAASLHWLLTCRDAFLFEDCVEDLPLRHELTIEKVQAVGGTIQVLDRPGLGVTLNEDFVKSTLVAESGR